MRRGTGFQKGSGEHHLAATAKRLPSRCVGRFLHTAALQYFFIFYAGVVQVVVVVDVLVLVHNIGFNYTSSKGNVTSNPTYMQPTELCSN